MVVRVNGCTRLSVIESLGDEYEVFSRSDAECDCAVTVGGSINDPAQINFEIIFQGMSLRTQVHITEAPVKKNKNSQIPWDHFRWKIKPATAGIWKDYSNGDDLGILKSDIDGIVLHNRTVLRTLGEDSNIIFKRLEK